VIARPVALGTLLLHLATIWRYGYFRDELYFIACARHLAWGYVDQPPLVALAAWLASPFGYALPAIRVLPALAAAAAAGLAVRVAKDLGGGRFAQWCAGITVALVPAYLSLGGVLTTTSFEALSWLLALWCAIRIVRGAGIAWWAGLGASFAFGMYGKYSIALLAVALIGGLLCTPERRVFASRGLPVAVLTAFVLLAPNLMWQGSHGWPMFEVLHGDAAHRHAFANGVALEYRNLWSNAIAFSLEQILYTDPIAVLLWLTGVIAPFAIPRLRDLRFVSVAYVVLFVVAAALGAKGYYIVGIYGALLAIGAVALEGARGWLRGSVLALVGVVGVATMPLSLPVLSMPQFLAYSQMLHLTGTPPHLIQPIYAEEFGWRRLAEDVADVYRALPVDERVHAAVYADTYADAGAIDLFGPRYGLPPAIASQNTYYLWGTHGQEARTLVAVGASRIGILKQWYRSCTIAAISAEPLKWVVEGPDPIYLCTHPRAGLETIWPHLRWYGA
jgi:hypothetical protein